VERLHALFILAWALLRSLFAPIVGARRGLAAFRASYAKDRLPAIHPDERRVLPTFSGCIACGMCDEGSAALVVRTHGKFAGVMDLMLASSRSMPDYDAAAASFEAIEDAELAKLERRCPTRVPMRAVKAFVLAKAAELDKAAE